MMVYVPGSMPLHTGDHRVLQAVPDDPVKGSVPSCPPCGLPAVFSMFVCVCVRVLLTGLGSTLPPLLTSPGTGVHTHRLYTSVRNIHLKPVGARARLST